MIVACLLVLFSPAPGWLCWQVPCSLHSTGTRRWTARLISISQFWLSAAVSTTAPRVLPPLPFTSFFTRPNFHVFQGAFCVFHDNNVAFLDRLFFLRTRSPVVYCVLVELPELSEVFFLPSIPKMVQKRLEVLSSPCNFGNTAWVGSSSWYCIRISGQQPSPDHQMRRRHGVFNIVAIDVGERSWVQNTFDFHEDCK